VREGVGTGDITFMGVGSIVLGSLQANGFVGNHAKLLDQVGRSQNVRY
jgi:hypothetical protein